MGSTCHCIGASSGFKGVLAVYKAFKWVQRVLAGLLFGIRGSDFERALNLNPRSPNL